MCKLTAECEKIIHARNFKNIIFIPSQCSFEVYRKPNIIKLVVSNVEWRISFLVSQHLEFHNPLVLHSSFPVQNWFLKLIYQTCAYVSAIMVFSIELFKKHDSIKTVVCGWFDFSILTVYIN